jgi:hypothetical protein
MEAKMTKFQISIGFLLGFFVLAPSSLAYGVVINVPTPAYPTIQAGIDAANNGDVVLVANGTFTGPGNREIDFGGKSITVQSAGGPENCIIDAQLNGRVFIFQNGEGEDSILSGFTITGGYVDGEDGGGIYIGGNSSPTVHNSIIRGNALSAGRGGGIYSNSSGSPKIRDCIVEDNSGWTGGIEIDGSASITNCIINNNFPDGLTLRQGPSVVSNSQITNHYANDGSGAGIKVRGTAIITSCNISNNGGDGGSGGGIYIINTSSVVIENCAIRNNDMEDGYGGGIYCQSSSPLIFGCDISNNKGVWGGAIACAYSSSPIIRNCNISGNKGYILGGGIYSYNSSPNITNSIIHNNEVGEEGAGIFIEGISSPNITNCTISRNMLSDEDVAGIYASPDSSPVIKNVILWGNFHKYGYSIFQISPDIDVASVTFTNIDQDGFEGINGNIRQDPLFVDVVNGDYHLSLNSPCIDVGTIDGAPDTDIDGEFRPQSAGYDMGADEYNFSDFDQDHDTDGSDLAYFVSEYPDITNPTLPEFASNYGR